MRKICQYQLDFFAPEVTVEMPAGAQIAHFDFPPGEGSQGAWRVPTVWALVDEHAPLERRQFAVIETGNSVPGRAVYVGTYLSTFRGRVLSWHVFELIAEPLPDGLELPDNAADAYRLLTSAGFTTREVRDCELPNGRPLKAWVAPDDEPLTTEQMIAVATLQEHGFGAVVSK